MAVQGKKKKCACGGNHIASMFLWKHSQRFQLINLLMNKPLSCIRGKKKSWCSNQRHSRLVTNLILSAECSPELTAGIKICQWDNKCFFPHQFVLSYCPKKRRKTNNVPGPGKFPILQLLSWIFCQKFIFSCLTLDQVITWHWHLEQIIFFRVSDGSKKL